MPELPFAGCVPLPKLDSSRNSLRLSLRCSNRTRPVVTHKCKPAGGEDFLWLEINRALPIILREGTRIAVAQLRQIILSVARI